MADEDAEKETLKEMIADLETPSRELTKWEEEFVASILEQINEGRKLSERQREVLRRIHLEKK